MFLVDWWYSALASLGKPLESAVVEMRCSELDLRSIQLRVRPNAVGHVCEHCIFFLAIATVVRSPREWVQPNTLLVSNSSRYWALMPQRGRADVLVVACWWFGRLAISLLCGDTVERRRAEKQITRGHNTTVSARKIPPLKGGGIPNRRIQCRCIGVRMMYRGVWGLFY